MMKTTNVITKYARTGFRPFVLVLMQLTAERSVLGIGKAVSIQLKPYKNTNENKITNSMLMIR